ncbi:MAG TPA: hypothetical protein VHW09_15815 [Bryobacteraceae bacterium]|jgi:hypothetical protein|nr:hypothetical protein [Bryobacteraceae bacterium]
MRSPQEAFASYYAAMSDEELLHVAANQESLVEPAQAALRVELSARENAGLVVPGFQKGKPDPGTWWWPNIWDAESARKAAQNSTYAAYFVGTLTGVFALVSIFKPLTFAAPSSLFDAALFAGLGFLTHRKMSRAAAVAVILLFVAERLYAAIDQARLSAGIGIMSVILLCAFIAGARGTFAYHEYKKDDLSVSTAG